MTLQELLDRRTLCLGVWTLARLAACAPFSSAWADAAIAAADALHRRETWAVAGKALCQSMTSGDEKRAARHRARLGTYRADPPPLAEDPSAADIERYRQWRVGTVHHWILVGELVRRQRAAAGALDADWLRGAIERGNLRSESLRPVGAATYRSSLDLLRHAGDGVPVVEIQVDGDGPVGPLPPGARWYPKYRTVSLCCEIGHLFVFGPGTANAVRSGPGIGNAVRAGTGHGNAVRRGGPGDAIRRGLGHGDAFCEGDGAEGLALRAGAGHGHAICRCLGRSGAERRGSGHGNAVTEGGLLGARRSGAGDGTAYTTDGCAYRTGSGHGDAVCVRFSPAGDPDVRVVRSGRGDGDAYGAATRHVVERLGRGAGRSRPLEESPHCSWSEIVDRREGFSTDSPAPSRTVHDAGSVRPPLHRLRVLRTGVARVPARAPVFYEAETNTYVLDSAAPGSIEVVGRGDVNVARRGSGAGDAIRSERGLGNAVRAGTGVGHAVRRGTGYGDAVRTGGGVGNAALGAQVVGDAYVVPPLSGRAVRTPGSAPATLWAGLGRPVFVPAPAVEG